MTEFIIRVWYTGPNSRELKCSVEKETTQVMEIRVPGSKSELLLWTDYPMIYHSKKKKGAKWKIKEGGFSTTAIEQARLLQNIFSALEAAIKEYLDKKKQDELPFQ